MCKWMNNNQISKFYFFKLREKFAEKQSTTFFLVSKDDIIQSIEIFNRYN